MIFCGIWHASSFIGKQYNQQCTIAISSLTQYTLTYICTVLHDVIQCYIIVR